MRIVCWVPKATNTHCRIAFPLQQWFKQRAVQLRYTDIDSLIPFVDKISEQLADILNLWIMSRRNITPGHNEWLGSK